MAIARVNINAPNSFRRKLPENRNLWGDTGRFPRMSINFMKASLISSTTLEVPRRTVSLDLLQLRAAVPNLPDVHRTIQLDPVVGARKWMQEAADMGLPCTYVEIEIVLSVPELAGWWRLLRCCRRLGEGAN